MRADFRSDTVTRPTPAMRTAIVAAEVGDAVYGDDPTVNRLTTTLAEELGFAAGLFVPSGVMSNLCALLAHCERGDEYLVGAHAHTYRYEGGGAAVLGSIQPQPIENAADGTLPLEAIEAAIKPDDPHFARTRLLCLENTWHGRALTLDYQHAATALAHAHGLQTHLDGARLFHAAIRLNVAPRAVCAGFDSVSVCLSKGLGAPIGSVLLGNPALMAKATRWRKTLGGGWRQAGLLAAAGLHALEHHREQLVADHARAKTLGDALSALGYVVEPVETNMVWLGVEPDSLERLRAALPNAPVLLSPAPRLRLVTHRDIDDAAVAALVNLMRSVR
jgi:threonine aldolase